MIVYKINFAFDCIKTLNLKDKIMDEYLNEIALAEKVVRPKSGDCPYTLFLGAGASVSSGIPSVNRIITLS